ncbi:MAG: hypothetical protein QME58_14430, partial [Bacteroidota bacterium]|nr:hypothetical protein [Bacteroidota bacterium]
MCHPETNKDEQVQLSTTESSCCKTIIAADRNTSEFLQAQKYDVFSSIQHSITPILHTSPSIEFQYSLKLFLTGTYSPPLIEDIPILNSSLLI